MWQVRKIWAALECYYYTAAIYEYFMRHQIGFALPYPPVFQAKNLNAYFNQIFKWAEKEKSTQVAPSISQTWQQQFLGPFLLPRCYICILCAVYVLFVACHMQHVREPKAEHTDTPIEKYTNNQKTRSSAINWVTI